MARRLGFNGNGAWSTPFTAPHVVGLSGCWGTLSAKISMEGGDFAAQWPPS